MSSKHEPTNREIMDFLSSFMQETRERFDKIEARLDRIEYRLDRLEIRVHKLEVRLKAVEDEQIAQRNDIKEIYDRIVRIEARVFSPV